jgi:hypothetical protein
MYQSIEREDRFKKPCINTHNIVSYVLHVMAYGLIVYLLLKSPEKTERRDLTSSDWFTYDGNTQTLNLHAKKLIIGDNHLSKIR